MNNNLSEKQIANLLKAADFLETFPQDKFEMSCYRGVKTGFTKIKSLDINKIPVCGTVGCALGSLSSVFPEEFEVACQRSVLPSANEEIKLFDLYNLYKKFGDSVFNLRFIEWSWCFGSDWSRTDNTPSGAAKRMRWLAREGEAPTNWAQQQSGKHILCY